MAARLATRLVAPEGGCLPLIDEAGAERAHQRRERRGIVAVIALVLARQQHVPGMVIIVVPLRAISAAWRTFGWIKQARNVVAILQHEMNVPAGLVRELPNRFRELAQHGYVTRRGDDMVG